MAGTDLTVADLTPVELHSGILLKREDLFRLPQGVNGSKLRACSYLLGRYRGSCSRVVSAASVLSPQNAMTAILAQRMGLSCTVILGGTKPETAIRHRAVALAAAAGAEFRYIPVGYNPALQRAATDEAAADPAAFLMPYGISVPPGASAQELRDFHSVGADQVTNLPADVRTLVIPFGSGNTAAGVLYGLSRQAPRALERIILMGIGPDRQQWLRERLHQLDAAVPVPVEHIALHPDYATYGDKMKASIDGIIMHPTYEGKVVRWADEHQPGWWCKRDGTTCLWVVGGPLQ